MSLTEKIIKVIIQPSRRAKLWWSVFFILLLTILAGSFDYAQPYNKLATIINAQRFLGGVVLPLMPDKPFHLGLDLIGGTHLVYQADLSQIQNSEQATAMEGVRDVIERRVNAFGVSEPDIRIAGNNNDRLNIELAGITNITEAINLIGATPLLEFKEAAVATPEEIEALEKENASAWEEARGRAEKALSEALKFGANWADLTSQFSDDPGSKDVGGDVGYITRGATVPEFETAVFDQLAVGETTKTLVKSQFGYHIIKKIDERKNSDGETEVKVSHILIAPKQLKNAELNWANTELSGKHVVSAVVVKDPQSGNIEVSLTFNKEGEELFGEVTGRNVGKQVAIFLDGQIISSPVVQQQIVGGSAVITGSFSYAEAKLLAQRLKAGALPVPIHLVGQQTVGASLGSKSVVQSLQAGLWGLLVVAAFMILYYRLPGVLAVVALLIYGVLVLAIFKIWPVTLTLSGIAGFILSLGMAVDANVLIFSRLSEELALGKPLGSAIDDAFHRSWPSIRDGNVSTLITCLILAQFSTSSVKGFAITLAVGIMVSMFSAMTITKLLLRLVASLAIFQKAGLYKTK